MHPKMLPFTTFFLQREIIQKTHTNPHSNWIYGINQKLPKNEKSYQMVTFGSKIGSWYISKQWIKHPARIKYSG